MCCALEVLRRGGTVVHATETCYGLACDLKNPEAVGRLFAIKERPRDQPVSALFSSIEDAKRYIAWNADAEELAAKYLPGPLTLILPLCPSAPHRLHPTPLSLEHSAMSHKQWERLLKAQSSKLKAEIRTLGVRISSHPLAQELVTRFGSPLSTTSANVHGEPNPYDPRAIFARFAEEELKPDLIIDSGTLPLTPVSTVIDLTGGGTILRRGSIHTER